MMAGPYTDAYVLGQIALLQAQIAKLWPRTLRATVSLDRHDGDEAIKTRYAELRSAQHRRNQALAAAERRVATLEAQLRDREVSAE